MKNIWVAVLNMGLGPAMRLGYKFDCIGAEAGHMAVHRAGARNETNHIKKICKTQTKVHFNLLLRIFFDMNSKFFTNWNRSRNHFF